MDTYEIFNTLVNVKIFILIIGTWIGLRYRNICNLDSYRIVTILLTFILTCNLILNILSHFEIFDFKNIDNFLNYIFNFLKYLIISYFFIYKLEVSKEINFTFRTFVLISTFLFLYEFLKDIHLFSSKDFYLSPIVFSFFVSIMSLLYLINSLFVDKFPQMSNVFIVMCLFVFFTIESLFSFTQFFIDGKQVEEGLLINYRITNLLFEVYFYGLLAGWLYYLGVNSFDKDKLHLSH